MTKEEKIKEAWGINLPKKGVSENGWSQDLFCLEFIDKENFETRFIGNNSFSIRPKSLQGIENNNGWIKIESEKLILPIDGTEVHFYNSFINENGIQSEYHKGIFNAALGFTSYYDSENYRIKEVTHYQPIEKPKPPIY